MKTTRAWCCKGDARRHEPVRGAAAARGRHVWLRGAGAAPRLRREGRYQTYETQVLLVGRGYELARGEIA